MFLSVLELQRYGNKTKPRNEKPSETRKYRIDKAFHQPNKPF